MQFIKVLLISYLVLLSYGAFAQEKSVSFGFKAGAGIATMSWTDAQDIIINEHDKALASFTAGAYASLAMGNFTLQPAVYYIANGGKTTEEVNQGDIVYRAYGNLRLNYLQVPINLIYNIKAGTGTYFIGAGPYIATGLKASFKPTSIDGVAVNADDFTTPEYKFGDGNSGNIKRFDYGANILAGYRFNNGLSINAGFNLGLSNIISNNYLNSFSKTRSALVSLSYQLP